jgi:hypothetical protein
MNKSFTLTLLLCLLGLWAKAQFSPQFSSSTWNIDSCSFNNTSNSTIVRIHAQVSNSMPGLNATVFWGDGGTSTHTIINFTGGQIGFSTSHIYALGGTYNVMSVLYDGSNTALDTFHLTVESNCYFITGKAYIKNDANCESLLSGKS